MAKLQVTQVFPSKVVIVRSLEFKMANAVKTSQTRKMQENKDPLSVSESVDIKTRNTTRGVESIAILHSAPVDLEQPEEDVDYNSTSDTIYTDLRSFNLDDLSTSANKCIPENSYQ